MRRPAHFAKHKHLRHPVHHKKHTHTNLLLMALGVFITYLLTRSDTFHLFLNHLGSYGYLGAFFAGALFVGTFTATTGAYILATLTETLNPWELGLIAGFGAVVADVTIFRFVKDEILEELEDIYNQFHGRRLSHLIHIRTFRWMLPVLGALIIASPLPDELGVALMGISRLPTWKFIILSFLLNSFGIFVGTSVFTLLTK